MQHAILGYLRYPLLALITIKLKNLVMILEIIIIIVPFYA